MIDIDYKLERSKRKTLTITIRNGEVTVKSPKTTSVEHIENFIAQKSAWIKRKLAEYDKKTDALKPVLDGSAALVYGECCPVCVSSKYKRVTLDGGMLYVPEKCTDDKAKEKAIAAWYKRLALKDLAALLYEKSQSTGLNYKTFALTNARTKWGSCDGNCNIRLNWRLVMLDRRLIDYVIVHELAHTVEHNHSTAFWAVVAKFCPDSARLKKSLKSFSVLTSLYR